MDAVKVVEADLATCWGEALLGHISRHAPPGEMRRVGELTILESLDPAAAERIARVLGGELDVTATQTRSTAAQTAARRQRRMRLIVMLAKDFPNEVKLRARVAELFDAGKAVAFIPDGSHVPTLIATNATRTIRFDDLRPLVADLARAMRQRGHGRSANGQTLEDWLGTLILPLPGARMQATLEWAMDAWEGDEEVDPDLLEDMQRLCSRELRHQPPSVPDGPASLAMVPGLRPAARRRLLRVADRLASHGTPPQGVVLTGPPGNGKTMLAGLLAAASGRSFIKASCSEWQACGHLGDHLKAIRATFNEARAAAPSVLFLDELDSVGRRGNSRESNYQDQVVNCLLEMLQGIGNRGDVALLAATNHPRSIDPAILRPGRFGEEIHIANPDRAGRKEVLSFYLGSLAPHDLADRVGTCSSVAIKELADETYLLATEDGAITPNLQHLEAAFSDLSRRHYGERNPARLAWSTALGLCAEAYMSLLAWGENVSIEGVSLRPGIADFGRVLATWADGEAPPRDTAADLLRLLHVQLAPAAARLSAAARLASMGGDGALDCFAPAAAAEVTMATATAAAFIATGAIGGVPRAVSPAGDDGARRLVAREWKRVQQVVRRGQPGIEAAAIALVERGWLDGATARAMLFGGDIHVVH